MAVLNSFESTHVLLLAELGWAPFTPSVCLEVLLGKILASFKVPDRAQPAVHKGPGHGWSGCY